jgi:hypothetical protein
MSVRRWGAWSAIATTALFVGGVAVAASAGIQTLIPPRGDDLDGWATHVHDHLGSLEVSATLVVLGGLAATVALLCFHEVLRGAHPMLFTLPYLAVVSMTLVTISHLMPVSIGQHLVPAYLDPGGGGQAAVSASVRTWVAFDNDLNLVGDLTLWGVVVPMVAFASLATRAVPRWIGWLGLVVGVLGGWVGFLGTVVPAVEGVAGLAFLGFFIWMTAMGVALLRSPAPPA